MLFVSKSGSESKVITPEPTATTSFRIVGTKPGQAWKIISKAPSSVQALEAEQLVTTALESAEIEVVPKD